MCGLWALQVWSFPGGAVLNMKAGSITVPIESDLDTDEEGGGHYMILLLNGGDILFFAYQP